MKIDLIELWAALGGDPADGAWDDAGFEGVEGEVVGGFAGLVEHCWRFKVVLLTGVMAVRVVDWNGSMAAVDVLYVFLCSSSRGGG